jgi:hypothetical protein
MAYFNKFPTVEYDVKGDGVLRTMTDITRRVRISSKARLSTVEFDFYDVIDGQTPEFVADRYYGDVGLHWLILMTNDIIDVYTDWPMSVKRFEDYVYSKYDDVNGIHHYEYTQESGDTSFLIELPNDSATTLPAGAVPVTNYEYEDRLQEKKRRIRLIKPEYIPEIKKEFSKKIKGV